MTIVPGRITLTDSEYRGFSNWLNREFGLQFGPEKRDILQSRLEPRRLALGYDTFDQLLFHLKYHPDRDAERQKLIPNLTNNESYFFREVGQLDILKDEILPELRSSVRSGMIRPARILSAGCAAGEEAYSIAILIEESASNSPVPEIAITGVDLDPAALDRARAAVYGDSAFRRTDPSIRNRYFTPVEKRLWKLDDRIRSKVRFEQANLADPEWVRLLPAQDVIFCRNVLIYFSDEALRSAIDAFYRLLRPGGVLFLGHAESLSRVPTRFVPIRRPGAIFYRRPEG